jgi:hypothetical protein
MKYHILSIGISKHQNPEANLQFASKDAADFFALFTQNVSNIGYKKLLTDNEATLSAIQTALGTELQNQVGVEDGFVLFYSGHGALAPEKNDAFTHYLVPFDVTEDIPNSSIPVDYIRGIFDKLNCKSKLFFVDSCFSGAVNSKSYGPSYKAIKSIKKLSDEISGEGSVTFTACKNDEKSIEDEKLQNGVFTSFLLSELQARKTGEKFSIIDIFTPIAEKTSEYTEKVYHFKQTPTFNGKLKEILYLPTFKKALKLRPEIIDVPKSQSVVEEIPLNPEIDISSVNKTDLVEKMVTFVVRTAVDDKPYLKLEFEKFVLELGKKATKKWEDIFKNASGTIDEVPDSVAKLEAECYQFFILSAAVGTYGNRYQVSLIAEICGDFLKMTRDKSGLIAMINVPEVIVVYIEYFLAMAAIATADFNRLKTFMESKVFGMRYDSEPPTMLDMYHIHYADALTGNANKVADYIRQGLKTMDWLKKIHPRLNIEDTDDLQIRANLVLVLTRVRYGRRAYADFGRFYSTRVLPIVERIKYDTEFSNSFSNLLGVEPKDLRNKLMQNIGDIAKAGMGSGFWYNSIEPGDFLTKKELNEREENSRKTSTNP